MQGWPIAWSMGDPYAFPHDMKKQMHFLMRHNEALIGWDDSMQGWSIRKSIGDSPCIPHDMKRQMSFLVIWKSKRGFKCECDEEALIVLKKTIYNFNIISNDENQSKFNNFCSIGHKIVKWPLYTLPHHEHFNDMKSATRGPKVWDG